MNSRNNTFTLLRHAETALEKGKVVSKWSLSKRGEKQALKISQQAIFQTIDKIYTSKEQKAYQTILPLAKALDKKISRKEAFNELNRDKGSYLESKEVYQQTVKQCFSNPNHSINNWEKAYDALERFSQGIHLIDRNYENRKILIVSHGLVLNLYFAKLSEQLARVYDRWLATSFCAYGVVQNKRIIKDIVRVSD